MIEWLWRRISYLTSVQKIKRSLLPVLLETAGRRQDVLPVQQRSVARVRDDGLACRVFGVKTDRYPVAVGHDRSKVGVLELDRLVAFGAMGGYAIVVLAELGVAEGAICK